MIFLVSIPYRDDKNQKHCYAFLFTSHLFQSLIGTIKTIEFEDHVCNYQFQSLIGTIKTISTEAYLFVLSCVSIPYRDDKNTVKKLLCVMPKISFNPL